VGWDNGRYYTRSKKVNGRVVREYVGSGECAELAAQIDAINREKRETEQAARRAEKAALGSLDAPLNELNDLADLLARAALLAAGYQQRTAVRSARPAALGSLDAPLNELNDLADLLARAALLAAGGAGAARREVAMARAGACRPASPTAGADPAVAPVGRYAPAKKRRGKLP
jgi:hypothetical protein